MSLFQVRKWWGVRDEAGAEYTPGALAVGNADNDQSGLRMCRSLPFPL